MPTRPDAPHPDALLTARGIARVIRATQPPGVPGMGEHAILAELRRMGAPKSGKWYRVRWADWVAWMSRPVQHIAVERHAGHLPDEQTPQRDDAAAWAAAKISDE